MISEDQVVMMYRLILGRDPESRRAIQEKLNAPSIQALLADMLMSDEFVMKNRDLIARIFIP